MSLPPRKARPMDILLRASARTRRDELSLAIVLEAESAGSVRPAVVVAHDNGMIFLAACSRPSVLTDRPTTRAGRSLDEAPTSIIYIANALLRSKL